MSEQQRANRLLRQARGALDAGDRSSARRLAQQAATLAPDLEAPWLFLAAVSDPRAGLGYVDRALAINPESRTAVKARLWLLQQLQKEEKSRKAEITRPLRVNRHSSQRKVGTEIPAGIPQEAEPFSLSTGADIDPPASAAVPVDFTDPDSYVLPLEAVSSRRLLSFPTVFLIFLVSIGLMAWVNLSPEDTNHRVAAAPLVKASFTPTPTNTPTPTMTYTPTPTFTPTPTPTFTPTPSPTWYANERRPYITDISELAHVGRWIDIDLGDQTLSVYEGTEPLETFLISSGTSSYPTVDGLFLVWRKYVSTDMSGPGYYLPDVPYTMFFYKGYGIHGTYWHDNFGTPMSHGCVNMRTEDARWVYEFSEIGTIVNVHP